MDYGLVRMKTIRFASEMPQATPAASVSETGTLGDTTVPTSLDMSATSALIPELPEAGPSTRVFLACLEW